MLLLPVVLTLPASIAEGDVVRAAGVGDQGAVADARIPAAGGQRGQRSGTDGDVVVARSQPDQRAVAERGVLVAVGQVRPGPGAPRARLSSPAVSDSRVCGSRRRCCGPRGCRSPRSSGSSAPRSRPRRCARRWSGSTARRGRTRLLRSPVVRLDNALSPNGVFCAPAVIDTAGPCRTGRTLRDRRDPAGPAGQSSPDTPVRARHLPPVDPPVPPRRSSGRRRQPPRRSDGGPADTCPPPTAAVASR